MKLVSVYDDTHFSCLLLFELLRERLPEESISHKKMPGWDAHCEFVESRPYLAWYRIEVGPKAVGACYLSKQREIGVGVLKRERGHRYGLAAVKLLMQAHPGKFLANVNPANEASAHLFQNLGFKHIQDTYAI